MALWIIIPIVAIVLTSVQLIPQLYKSIKTKKVRDVSLGMTIIISLGAFTWLIYGIHISDLPIIIANSLNLTAGIILTILKIKY